MHRITILAGIAATCLLMTTACRDAAEPPQIDQADFGPAVEKAGDAVEHLAEAEPFAHPDDLDTSERSIASTAEKGGEPAE
jgi:hypothetical protein